MQTSPTTSSVHIGLFYGSSTCYTEMAAEKIIEVIAQLAPSITVDLHNINQVPVAEMSNYHYLILGIPTWDYGELQEDWENSWDDLDTVGFSGKQVAIYGLGDQIGYPEWFQDALGFLWAKVVSQGAETAGQWPNKGFTFEQSKALSADEKFFVGLPLDDENQFELTDDRINQWCQQVLSEFDLQSVK